MRERDRERETERERDRETEQRGTDTQIEGGSSIRSSAIREERSNL